MNNIKNDILETISNMPVSELLQLVKDAEEKWGVSAAASAAPAADSSEKEEEKSDFEVVVVSMNDGANKVACIKAVRAITGLGLREAKELVESGGSLEGRFDKDASAGHKKALEEAGLKIELK
ncbi:50S ribosomal protein L7/L12 [Candidatus Cytomitobacter indipagum]|uniref:Large ribosomal subunit protein bL12 n=1 Tax=Candidatus Cytomitobacter indipagum TaxID=2601575 RepID=A0A5C0UDM9_9PROT|nr:50S ribosomal protein L7/L12 [Candidatus Cytomitobacter indipagum]QEK37867.1 50S ribosomal protein L7/L12 [Candidatus Cytomitobacter indipagum]